MGETPWEFESPLADQLALFAMPGNVSVTDDNLPTPNLVTDKKLAGCITQPDEFGLQARISRRREISRYFAFADYDWDPDLARAHARKWLDKIARDAPPRTNMPRLNLDPDQPLLPMHGVYRSVRRDKRRDLDYLQYQVTWARDGRNSTKSFYVGRADVVDSIDERPAALAAASFRLSWAASVWMREPFDPRYWSNWRNREFSEEALLQQRDQLRIYIGAHYPQFS